LDKENFYFLGYIAKAHRQKSELVLILDVDNPKDYKKLESFFIEIDKELVPFFIESIELKSHNKAFIRLQDINLDSAEFLAKRSVYLPLDQLPILGGNKFYFHEVIDFEVIDLIHGNIGTIKDIIDIQPQSLLKISFKEKEILIPIVDDIIKNVDRDKRQIVVEAPEGLIDLYLEI